MISLTDGLIILAGHLVDYIFNYYKYYKGTDFHKITNNGFLNLHTDFNNYKDTNLGSLDRRINMLIYLNPNWKEEYKGHLWLCNKDTKIIGKKILQILNRCVIFSTTNTSIHVLSLIFLHFLCSPNPSAF